VAEGWRTRSRKCLEVQSNGGTSWPPLAILVFVEPRRTLLAFSGSGTNTFQFVRTQAAWKIASVVWDDN
jgi:hypothetical protein